MSSNNGKSKKEFGTAQEVYDVSEQMQNIEDWRARDRKRINSMMNGQRPYTKDEEDQYHIELNVNWGEAKRLMLDANRQLNNALLHPGTLFNCNLEAGPEDKRDEWSGEFTKAIHVPLQRGRSGKRHHFVLRSRNATICMHGIGALMWPNDFKWLPRFVPLEDLLIPTDTYADFTNLRYFAVNMYLTPGELIEMTMGPTVGKGWNNEQIIAILKAHKKLYTESTPSTWKDQPEAMKQIHDQNKGYYYSDAIPKIRLRYFFWQSIDEDSPGVWHRSVVLRETYGDAKVDKFVYDGKDRQFANSIDHLLNVQYGDNNIVAPLKYHSVRGLGTDLFAPSETINRLRCEFVWNVFEHMKMWFKIQDPADRDRLKQVQLAQFGFIPEGLTIVPREQRHQIDANLVDNAMSQTRQLMQESSAAFVQDVDTGTQKEMTAREAQIRLNQVNVMVSGMLQMMYVQEGFYYQELVRRFLNPQSGDPDVKAFRKKMLDKGIPEDLLKEEYWRVEPERVLGSGDKSLAQAQSLWLMQNRTAYGPESQQKILRIVTGTMLEDVGKAKMLVPEQPVQATVGVLMAEQLFGTLMAGIQCTMREGIDYQGYAAKLIAMMAQVVQRISQTDNMGTIEELIGLQTCAQNAGQYLMALGADASQKQLVKQLSDALGKILNDVKGFAQRIMESKQQHMQQGNGDPAGMAKAQSTVMLAQLKAKINEENAQLKQRQRALSFNLDQQLKQLETIADIRREDLRHHQGIMHENARQAVELMGQLRQKRVAQEEE